MREETVGIAQQNLRMVVLLQLSPLQYQDLIRVDNCVQPVGYRDDSAVPEGIVHCLIYNPLSADVDVGCGLVYQHNLRWLQDSSRDADQLSLSHTQIFSVLGNLGLVEIVRQSADPSSITWSPSRRIPPEHDSDLRRCTRSKDRDSKLQ